MAYEYAVRNYDTDDLDIRLYTDWSEAQIELDFRKEVGIDADILERDEWDEEVKEYAEEKRLRDWDFAMERGQPVGYGRLIY